MSESNNRQFVSFSIGHGSGLMFYVSYNSTGEYRVFIGSPAAHDEVTTVLPLRELIRHDVCRCPDPAHNTKYTVVYKGETVELDTLQDCTQLDPADYHIEETDHGVVITKKLFVK